MKVWKMIFLFKGLFFGFRLDFRMMQDMTWWYDTSWYDIQPVTNLAAGGVYVRAGGVFMQTDDVDACIPSLGWLYSLFHSKKDLYESLNSKNMTLLTCGREKGSWQISANAHMWYEIWKWNHTIWNGIIKSDGTEVVTTATVSGFVARVYIYI